MKKLMMIAAMMVAAVSANAQFEPGTFSIQPKMGGVASWLSNLPDQVIPRSYDFVDKDVTVKSTLIGGFVVGVEAEYQLAKKLSLAAGVNYSLQGGGWDNYEFKNGNEERNIKDVKLELGYVTVPVMANVYLFKGFAVKGGVQFGFMTNASNCCTLETKLDKLKGTFIYEDDVKSKYETFDLSIPMGVSYQFNIPIVLDLRYNLGLTKVNKESDPHSKDFKNNVIQLTVGYKFAL